jgi:hypothetical protein
MEDVDMHRFAFGLVLTGAFLTACAAVTALPSRVVAFELQTGAVTVPGGSTQFQDPDEKPLPPPLILPKLEEDGTSSQMASGTNLQSTPAAGLQLTPGMSLQVTAGSGPSIPGLQSGLPMAPLIDRTNPADNRSLIPAP